MAEGMAFDQLKPPVSVTDPLGLGLMEWPKHMHKAGTAEDGGPLYIVVKNADEVAGAMADGWSVARADALAAPSDGPPSTPPTRKR
jgi:hypothetical protein